MPEELKPLTTDNDKLDEIAYCRGIIATLQTSDEFIKRRLVRMLNLANMEMIARRSLQVIAHNRDKGLKFIGDAWKDESKERLIERMAFINDDAHKNFHQLCIVVEAVGQMMTTSPEEGIDAEISKEINKQVKKLHEMMTPITKAQKQGE